MTKKIFFTGGGTAGHVTPNLALIDYFQQKNWSVGYIGSTDGIEKDLVTNIPYFSIATGKLRRYFSWQNFIDPLKVIVGIAQAIKILLKQKPDIVFSKGGFVAFPVVFAAWICRIPVIAHESDFSPGLANRLSFPFATKICTTFKSTQYPHKTVVTGSPIRPELLQGDRAQGLAICGFTSDKPIILIMGGSSGSQIINQTIRQSLPELLMNYQIIHCCGKDKVEVSYHQPGYYQIPYAKTELPHFFAAADFIISRAGANAVYEILSLQKPHLFIPLSKQYSRGDQIENAAYFEKQGTSQVLLEADLTPENLIRAIALLARKKWPAYPLGSGLQAVAREIIQLLSKS